MPALKIATSVFIVIVAVTSQQVIAAELPIGVCGDLKNAYGPFDYNDPKDRAEKLPIVDDIHFTRDVEQLRKGASGSVVGDLDYTLRAFPNHHRALAALARYALGGRPLGGQFYSVDCYFERAMRWRPDDAVVKVIYADYLAKRGSAAAAEEQYEKALRLEPDSAEVNYSAGLFYYKQKNYERALACARIAYSGGYPLPGLKNKLIEAGVWRKEP